MTNQPQKPPSEDARGQAATELVPYNEDGSNRTTANSYVTLDEFNQYLEDFNYDSTATPASKITALRQAAIILDGMGYDERKWIGNRATSDQYLAWPRSGARFDGQTLSATKIPGQIKLAQMQLAYYILNGDLEVDSVISGKIQEVKISVIDVKYAEPVSSISSRSETYQYVREMIVGFLREIDTSTAPGSPERTFFGVISLSE